MEKELKVTCPCCDSILIIDRISGKILETRKPLVDNSSGNRLKDAFLKVEQDREKRATAFENISERQEKQKEAAKELFNASLESAKKEKIEKPGSIYDHD